MLFLETDVQDLRETLEKVSSVTLSIDGRSMKTRRGLQNILSIRHKDPKKQHLYELFLSYVIKSEEICPGGYEEFIARFLKKNLNDRFVGINTKSDLLELINDKIEDKTIVSMLTSALEYSTASTHFSIKKNQSSLHAVELCQDYKFFCQYLLKDCQTIEVFDSKILCIDGFIESVSELHHILEWLSCNHVPCVLFVRGMSNDVLHTIKVNNERRTLQLYPYVVPFDVENVNTIVDIAVVSGNDVISSLKGELISTIDMRNINKVDRCLISKNQISIKNSRTKDKVQNHLFNLKSTLQDRQELSDILSKRVKSLTSSCIDLYLPDDINYYSKSQQLDEGIRIISSILSNSRSSKESLDKLFQSFQDSLQGIVQTCLL